MAHRMPERRRRLPGQRAARTVGDGARNHQRRADAALLEDALAGENRRLGVERVKDRLDQNNVGAAVEQADDLLSIGFREFVKSDGAKTGILDVGRDRRGAVGRPQGAGDESTPAVNALGFERRAARQPRPVAVKLIDAFLQAVVSLGDAGRGKRVGFENVRPRHGVGEVDVLDRLRPRQRQQVVVALEVAIAGGKTFAAEIALFETSAWTWVPMAPSSTRIFSRASAVSAWAASGLGASSLSEKSSLVISAGVPSWI